MELINGALPHAGIRAEEQEVADFLVAAEAENSNMCSGKETDDHPAWCPKVVEKCHIPEISDACAYTCNHCTF